VSEFELFEVVPRSLTFKLRGDPITLHAGARLRIAVDDPTVDRTKLDALIAEGALRPVGGFRRVGVASNWWRR
jgi:hypothetical protein